MARAALATGLKSGITSIGKPRRPGRRRLGRLAEKAKLLDAVTAKSYVLKNGRVA